VTFLPTLIMGVALIILTNWNWDAGSVSLSTAPVGDVTDSSTFANGENYSLVAPAWTGAKHQEGTMLMTPFKAVTAQKLVCIAEGVTGTPTAGSAEVYLAAYTL
jgi:hypothetical protein